MLVSFFDQIILNSSDVNKILNIFIKSWVDSHVFCSNSKPFTMFLLTFYVKDKWDDLLVLSHHLFDKVNCQVNSFDYQRFISFVKSCYDFGKLFLHDSSLFLVTFETS